MNGLGLGYKNASLITTSFVDPNSGASGLTSKGPGRTVGNSTGVNDIIEAYPQVASGYQVSKGGDSILIGGPGNSWIGGGAGADLIFGNNVTLINKGANITNARFQALTMFGGQDEDEEGED